MQNNKMHILVVDDDNRIRNLLKEYLSDNNSKNLNAASRDFYFQLLENQYLSVEINVKQNYINLRRIRKNWVTWESNPEPIS